LDEGTSPKPTQKVPGARDNNKRISGKPERTSVAHQAATIGQGFSPKIGSISEIKRGQLMIHARFCAPH